MGPQTGDPRTFKTFDEFYQALWNQYSYWIDMARNIGTINWNLLRDITQPLASVATHDCLEKGLDCMDGGARYGGNDGICFAGGVDVTNALAAIKKLVYDDKAVDMDTLIKALHADWEGYEDIRKMCLDAPKFGNDDDYVDMLGRKLHEDLANICLRFPDFLGRWELEPMAYSVTAHWPLGASIGATPDGRKAGVVLTDASVSAARGTDKKGPTALVNSAVKLIDTVKWGTNHFNVKFHPTALEGAAGAQKLLQLIKTYYDLGGYHIQFNCVSQEVLKAARAKPEEHQDLVVRVAGFSAFFVALPHPVQDEVIERTEQRL